MVRATAACEPGASAGKASGKPAGRQPHGDALRSREMVMKRIGVRFSSRIVRILGMAVVPVVIAGAVIVPTAGVAHALQPSLGNAAQCQDLLQAADDNWDDATHYELDGDSALANGNIVTWAEDNVLENHYEDEGDAYWGLFSSAGCKIP
jgi:hypothetical protein